MNQKKLITRFFKATQGLAYWSREFLKVHNAIAKMTESKSAYRQETIDLLKSIFGLSKYASGEEEKNNKA